MLAHTPTSTALDWASAVTPRHYRRHREELDELILSAVPSYAVAVASTLDQFDVAVRDARVRYDEENSVGKLLRPLRVTWLTSVLFWLSLIGGMVALAVMIARGGPSFNFDDARWDIRVPIAALVFATGVSAQLIRGLPIRIAAPPRRDYSFISTVFGVFALVQMIRLPSAGVAVEPVWIVVTASALAASLAYAVPYQIARLRDRELTRRVDSLEEKRLVAAGDRLEQQADEFAIRLEADFDALPNHDQKSVRAELSAATAVLRQRGIIDTPTGSGARSIRTRATRHIRPMYPGFLLLEKRVQQVWDLRYSEPRSRLPVNWFIAEYLPRRRRAETTPSR